MPRTPEELTTVIPEKTRKLMALAYNSETANDQALDAITKARRDITYLYNYSSEAISERKTKDLSAMKAQRKTLDDAITVEYSKKMNPDTNKAFTTDQVKAIVASNPNIASIEQRMQEAEVSLIQMETNANIFEQELKNCDQRQSYLSQAFKREMQREIYEAGMKGINIHTGEVE